MFRPYNRAGDAVITPRVTDLGRNSVKHQVGTTFKRIELPADSNKLIQVPVRFGMSQWLGRTLMSP